MSTYGVRIVRDPEEPIDYDPEVLASLASGEYESYGLVVVKQCSGCGEWRDTDTSLWSVVVAPTTLVDCVVTNVREISDEYLRETAGALIMEESVPQ